MEKEDNRKSSPEGLPSLSAIQILICILLLSDHRPLVTDLLLIDSVGYAELCVLTGADESIQNGSTIVALSKNVHPVCQTLSIRLTVQEGTIAASYKFLIVKLQVLELITEEESLRCFTAANLTAV